jgi:hypothetical protein
MATSKTTDAHKSVIEARNKAYKVRFRKKESKVFKCNNLVHMQAINFQMMINGIVSELY